MKVLTLDEKMLVLAVADLSDMLGQVSDVSFVIGVERGGVAIAQQVHRHVVEACADNVVGFGTVKCQRLGTDKKIKHQSIIKSFPVGVANFLRVVESKVVSLKMWLRKGPDCSGRKVVLSPELDKLESDAAHVFLIVDDAVDSGDTLFCIVNELQSLFKNARFVTACLTLTQRKPSLVPDYCLHQDVLIRFPWSSDFHA